MVVCLNYQPIQDSTRKLSFNGIEGAIEISENTTLKHSFNMNTGYSLDNRGYNINTIGDIINSGVIKGNGKLILEKGNGYQTIQSPLILILN